MHRSAVPKDLFGPEGQAALRALLQGRPLLAFDFDGTLTPIVPRPDDARLRDPVAARLQRLSRRLPVAVVSGRSVADLRVRLGFEPTYVVGCHGADDPADAAATQQRVDRLRRWRHDLAACVDELAALHVQVEDKGAALALHYRHASHPGRAKALLFALLDALPPGLRGFGGKCVINVVPADAPDKADAVFALVQRSAASAALFVGDDLNDEPVFERAPPGWLTVHVGGPHQATSARFCVDGPPDVERLLDALLRGFAGL